MFERRTVTVTWLAILLAMLFLCACEEKEISEDEAQAEVVTDLMNFMPDQDYLAMGYLDLQSVLNSRWGVELLEMFPSLEVWDKKLGAGVNDFHQMLFAAELKDNDFDVDPNMLIILRSELSEKQLIELISEKESYFEQKEVAGYKQFISGSDFSFSILGRGVVALGTPESVEKTILVTAGKEKSFAEGERKAIFDDYLASRDNFWLGLPGLPRIMDQVAKEAPFLKNWKSTDFLYFGINVDDSISSRMMVHCDSEEIAGKFARSLSSFAGMLGVLINSANVSDMELEGLGFDAEEIKDAATQILDELDIHNQKENVVIKLEVPEDLIDIYMGALRQLIKDSFAKTGSMEFSQNETTLINH
jgi:hypothetical protein